MIQSAEVCDGDYEVDGRALCADGTPCSTSADCSDNSVCGSAAPACGLSASGRAQARTRACTTSCAWPVSSLPGGWDVCQEVGECGDGNLDAGEACDDGAQNSNSASCKLDCTLNVCGDGDRLVGVESCDLGSQNGEPCVASYNSTCNFCTNTCTYQTLTGPFCGNGSIDAGEYCDGSAMPKRCFKESPNPANREVGDVCTTVAECPTDGTWYCSDVVGVCNGGSREDQPSFVYNGAPCLGNTANGNRACGQNLGPNLALMGTCVVADCNTSCSASCPFSYNEGAVLVQAEGNSQVTDSAKRQRCDVICRWLEPEHGIQCKIPEFRDRPVEESLGVGKVSQKICSLRLRSPPKPGEIIPHEVHTDRPSVQDEN
ncbi:MAG: hypothetical protein UY81_C0075G0007 [Candidatus Giovannonibacteria bacterium GW2011_GWA2_53_7]|uniref:Disintegrin domain-containing protein n=1 Tax=Candidatus Giovannonibacteria bacterium GW2011_GWA2_53_7 TaxID=1618650 RepID=A0A0G2ANY9_9BACT|nr:MAG: hypothetical protein UY81_C0075G0007 [Candidatus Giovannonibacteria bacterium GW2011_GWA2_53_7]